MKTLLMGAAAAAVLTLAAAPAIANEDHACFDAFCQTEVLFADTPAGGGAAEASPESPRATARGASTLHAHGPLGEAPGDDFYEWANCSWPK